MFIHIPGEETRLQFDAPSGVCCNCGTRTGVSFVDTPLKKTRWLLFAGTELRFLLALPYCRDCRATAPKFRPGFAHKTLVAAMLWPAMVLAYTFLGPPPGEGLPLRTMAWMAAALSLAISFLYYGYPPRKPRTSRTQPVSLAGLKQQFSGEIKRIDLRFTNADYARLFADRNQELIEVGVLQARVA